ncbi:MAG: PKD domain-containing protein [Euryarchaeota archaeon]|nr:PKD domain-containing protein [Euryarchaeota archaeon]MDE2045953.1 PKD domain-containing protein [Thermoplasmata archaeon]
MGEGQADPTRRGGVRTALRWVLLAGALIFLLLPLPPSHPISGSARPSAPGPSLSPSLMAPAMTSKQLPTVSGAGGGGWGSCPCPWVWTNITSQVSGSPGPRAYAGTAWTPPTAGPAKVVLQGGSHGSAVSGPTWAYTSSTWSQIYSRRDPAYLVGASMLDDPSLGGFLLFGGLNASRSPAALSASTYVYWPGNQTWENLSAAQVPSPSPRYFASAAFDTSSGDVVLYGGCDHLWTGSCITSDSDTWVFTSGQWQNVTSSVTGAPPPALWRSGFTNNSSGSDLLLVDGISCVASSCSLQNGSWTFYASTYQWKSHPGPPTAPRFDEGLAWDTPAGGDVLFGGCTAASGSGCTTYVHDTWLYKGGSWLRLFDPSSPSARGGTALSFDASDGYLLLYGGCSAAGCPLGDTWTLSPPPKIVPAVNFRPNPGSPGVLEHLYGNATGGVPPYTSWTWYENGNPIGSTENTSWTPGASGSYTITLYVRDQNGALGGINTTLFVQPISYSAYLSASPSSGSAPLSVNLYLSFSGTPPSQPSGQVCFGDGSPCTLSTVFMNASLAFPHTYAAPGNYVPWGWVNASSQSVAAHTYVNATGPLAASATALIVRTDIGRNVPFNGTAENGTPAYVWHWDFGDGTSAATENPIHAYSSAGNYTAILNVTDQSGTSRATDRATIEIDRPLGLSLSYSANDVHPGTAVSVTAGPWGGNATVSPSPQNLGYSLAWSVNNSPPACDCVVEWFYPHGAGTIHLNVTATDEEQVNATVPGAIFVLPNATSSSPLTVSVALPSGPLQNGTSETATATVGNGTAPFLFNWSLNGTGFVKGSTASITLWAPSHGGSYFLTVNVTDSSAPAEFASARATVNVVWSDRAPPLLATLSVSSTHVTTVQMLWLNASASGGSPAYEYAWAVNASGGGGGYVNLTSTPRSASSFSLVVQNGGVYQYVAWVTDGAGAVARSSPVSVTVAYAPGQGTPLVAALTPGSSSIKAGDSVSLTASATGGSAPYSYLFQVNGTGTGSFVTVGGCATTSFQCVVTLVHSGTYHFVVVVTDSASRTATSTPVQVVVNAPTSAGPTSKGLGALGLLLLLVLIIVVALLGILYLRRRRSARAALPRTPDSKPATSLGGEGVAPSPSTVASAPEPVGASAANAGPSPSPSLSPSPTIAASETLPTSGPSAAAGAAPAAAATTEPAPYDEGTEEPGREETWVEEPPAERSPAPVRTSATPLPAVSPPPKPSVSPPAARAPSSVKAAPTAASAAPASTPKLSVKPKGPAWPMVPLTVVEAKDPASFWEMVAGSGLDRTKLLVFSLEAPGSIAATYGLVGATLWRISRTEGEENLAPGDVDRMGDLIERHFSKGSGRAVVLRGIERIIDSAGLRSAVRLIEVAREVGEETRGAVLVHLNPDNVQVNERRQLEEGAKIVRLLSSSKISVDEEN